ncbi:MAG: monovalent cation/H+ antiporter subunit D family protein [Alphaproteobacteria bacterium]|nr:monovalent cation/H+ antiporter subunit D family protein [Alphaproteobacteria bacterium]
MTLAPDQLLLWAFLTPIIVAVLVAVAGPWRNLRDAISVLGSLATFGFVAMLASEWEDKLVSRTIADFLPGLTLRFSLEPLGLLFAVIASTLWVLSTIYAIGYMRANEEHDQTRFFALFALAIAATLGIAFSGNLLTLFVFYETLTLVTFPLVTHAGTPEAMRAGRTYLGILLSTSILFFFLAMVWTYFEAGTLDFIKGGILNEETGPSVTLVLFLLYMFGIAKTALMPFHRWLPAAMVAPTPVSALLHAVAVVKAGVFAVVKVIVYVLGVERLAGVPGTAIVPVVAGFTIIAASLVALKQANLKRLLAYSTISQLSYVVLSATLLTPISIMGAVLHIAMHAVAKITLFFAAGAVYTAAHKSEIGELDGIGRRMPWTMGAFAVAALSMIGLPPTAGFVSKWVILKGAFDATAWCAVAVLVLSTVLNAAYFLPIVHRAFFRPLSAEAQAHPHGEAPFPSVLALTLTALLTLGLFFFPGEAMKIAEAVATGR